jgi:hypothetical protein
MTIWKVSALKKANQWALKDPFGQSALTNPLSQMRRHSMNQRGLFCAFRGRCRRSNKAQCALSADPRPINRRGCTGWLNETPINVGLVRGRRDTVTALSIRHHRCAPAVAAYNLFGSDGSSVKKVVLKFGERWLNECGDQGSACNEEREHKEHLPLASHSRKDNFWKKGTYIRLAPISASGLRSPFVREI